MNSFKQAMDLAASAVLEIANEKRIQTTLRLQELRLHHSLASEAYGEACKMVQAQVNVKRKTEATLREIQVAIEACEERLGLRCSGESETDAHE